jgi:hypothetical protein
VRRTAVVAVLLALAVAAPAGAAVRLTTGPVTSLTLEGRRAAVRPAAGDAVFLVDARSGRVDRRVPLRGADLALVSGPRLATITRSSPDSNRLLDRTTLRLTTLERAPVATDRQTGLSGRVWSSLLGRGGLVVAVRDRYEPSPTTPDCLDGGPCDWVRTGQQAFAWAAGSTARRTLPAGRVLDADATRVLILDGRQLVTANARGRVVARLTLPSSLPAVRYGRLGGGARVLLVAAPEDRGAAVLLRGGRAVWTGTIAGDAAPAFAGTRIVWGTGPRVWLRDARAPTRRVLVARCRVAVSAVAVSGAGVAWACRGRGAGAWATPVG